MMIETGCQDDLECAAECQSRLSGMGLGSGRVVEVQVVWLGQAQWPMGFPSMVQLEERNIRNRPLFTSSFMDQKQTLYLSVGTSFSFDMSM